MQNDIHIIPTAATGWLKEKNASDAPRELDRTESWTTRPEAWLLLVNYLSLQLSLGHASGTLLHRVWCMQSAAKQFDLAAKQAAARLSVLASKQASCCKAVWPCCKASKLLQSGLILLQSKQAAAKQFDLAAKQASCYKAVWSCCKATWSFCKACCRKNQSDFELQPSQLSLQKKSNLSRFQVKQMQQLK